MPRSARGLRLGPYISLGRHPMIKQSFDMPLCQCTRLSRGTGNTETASEQKASNYELGHLFILCCACLRFFASSKSKRLVKVSAVKTI
jgi:hypothetical protein